MNYVFLHKLINTAPWEVLYKEPAKLKEMSMIEVTMSSHIYKRGIVNFLHYFSVPAQIAYNWSSSYEPRREKTCLRGFRQGATQTGLYSHRR